MIVSFFNKKGGVGKTSIAYSVAKDLDYFLLSNDDSVIETVYKNKAKVLDKLEVIENANVVYDLGGFIEDEIIEVFKKSDIIIIPATLDINSVKRTINTVVEIEKYNKNIVIVINRISAKKQHKYKESILKLSELNKKIFLIRESEAFANSMYKAKTITELYNENALMKNAYKGVYEDYTKLLNYIKGVEKWI